jgi:uncharacterized protein YjbI with pentapeptide repeats
MAEFWVIFVMLCLLIATGSALVALRMQYRLLDKTRQEREAWQQAQEGRQRTWEVRQGKHILDAERKLADQLKDARREWRSWSVEVEQNHQTWLERADIEKELARLSHVEQLELLPGSGNRRLPPPGWRPSLLYRADLRGHDLSHRYMERADLREARLAGANLYMADLSGAILTGANLENANLTGANLSGADLRGANLSGASFLVSDLHQALLHGAILLGAHHLATRQLHAALYDDTTVIDSSLDVTLPRLPGVQIVPADLPGIPQSVRARRPDLQIAFSETKPAAEGRPAKGKASTSPAGAERTVSNNYPVSAQGQVNLSAEGTEALFAQPAMSGAEQAVPNDHTVSTQGQVNLSAEGTEALFAQPAVSDKEQAAPNEHPVSTQGQVNLSAEGTELSLAQPAVSGAEQAVPNEHPVAAQGQVNLSGEGTELSLAPPAVSDKEQAVPNDHTVSTRGQVNLSGEGTELSLAQSAALGKEQAVLNEHPVAAQGQVNLSAEDTEPSFAQSAAPDKEQAVSNEHTVLAHGSVVPPEGGGQAEYASELPAEASERQAESNKIIQLSTRAARITRQLDPQKRTSPAKGSGRKGKSTPNRARKSNG